MTPEFRVLEFKDIIQAHVSAALIIKEWAWHYLLISIVTICIFYIIATSSQYFMAPFLAVFSPVVGLVLVINYDKNLNLSIKEIVLSVINIGFGFVSILILVTGLGVFISVNPDLTIEILKSFLGASFVESFGVKSKFDSEAMYGFTVGLTAFLYKFSTALERKYFEVRFSMNRSESFNLIVSIMEKNTPSISVLIGLSFVFLSIVVGLMPVLAPIWVFYSVNAIYYCLKAMYDGGAKHSQRESYNALQEAKL